MVWLIGIISIILIVVFWRIFLPLAIVIAVIAVGLFMFILKQEEPHRTYAPTQPETVSVEDKVEGAKQSEKTEPNRWFTRGFEDPASGKRIVRAAEVWSQDGLCLMSVQVRLDGNQLTGIDCQEIEINTLHSNVEIKFSEMNRSFEMELSGYRSGNGAYISSNQRTYGQSRYMKYDSFIQRLKTDSSVAMKIPLEAVGDVWVKFSLNESASAISMLGRPMPQEETTKSNRD